MAWIQKASVLREREALSASYSPIFKKQISLFWEGEEAQTTVSWQFSIIPYLNDAYTTPSSRIQRLFIFPFANDTLLTHSEKFLKLYQVFWLINCRLRKGCLAFIFNCCFHFMLNLITKVYVSLTYHLLVINYFFRSYEKINW